MVDAALFSAIEAGDLNTTAMLLDAGADPNGRNDRIEQARRWYAEELRFTANVRARAVIEAFATVPRERFVGAGPWRIRSPGWRLGPGDDYWTTEDADLRHVYL